MEQNICKSCHKLIMAKDHQCKSQDVDNESSLLSLVIFVLCMITFAFIATELLQEEHESDDALNTMAHSVSSKSQVYF